MRLNSPMNAASCGGAGSSPAAAFAGFPHGGVRQTHDVKGGQAAGEKALGSDLISGNAGQSKGTHGSDHREDLLAENVKNM